MNGYRSYEEMPLIERIVKHPEVSRAMMQPWKSETPALAEIVRLRKSRRDVKRSARNMQDEVAHGRPDYEHGGQVCVPPMPGSKRLLAALAADGLPEDLRAMIEEYLHIRKEARA